MSNSTMAVNQTEWATLDSTTVPPSAVPFTAMTSNGGSFQLPPINTLRNKKDPIKGFWDENSFNQALCLPPLPPPGADPSGLDAIPNSLLFTFQSQAPGFLEISLSPTPDFKIGATYQVTFGGASNMKCVIKRRTEDGPAFANEVPARVCDPNSWINYFVAIKEGKLYAGVNDDSEDTVRKDGDWSNTSASDAMFEGHNTLVEADDCMYEALRGPEDRVKYVGLGNFSSIGFKSGGKGNGGLSRAVKVRACALRYMTDADKIHKAKKQGNKIFLVKPKLVDGDNSTPYGYETTKRLFDEWSKECEVQRVRADKFGHEYSVPQLESFLKWSEAKRMRSAPQTAGFITGIDTESKEEEDKRAKRQERFEADRKRELAKKRGREGEEEMEEEENTDMVADEEGKNKEPQDLPPVMAYTSEGWLRKYRVDPVLGDGSSEEMEEDGGVDENGEVKKKKGPVVEVREKIHMFCVDVAAFKQLRTNDILGHFKDFGPSYVEWLGETSVNVCFEDKYSAQRALKALSQEVEAPPVKEEKKEEDATMEEGEGEKKEGEEEGGEENPMEDGEKEKDEKEDVAPTPHLGELGWKFCRRPMIKVADDKFGRKGTRCRFLLRFSTSQDCLEERDDVVELPMPKNFSRDAVIDGRNNNRENDRGGGADGGRDQKRRRNDNRGGGHYEREDNFDYSFVPEKRGFNLESAMEGGLSSGRGGNGGNGGGGGFSLAEIEAERAAARAARGEGEVKKKVEENTSGRWADQDDSDDDL